MFFIQNIPHMRVYKQRVRLPLGETSQTLRSMVFMNTPTFESSMDCMRHPLFVTNSKYRNYYIEPMYNEKIKTRQVKLVKRKHRDELYDIIDQNFKMYGTPLKFEQLRNRNVYYDMHIYNSIFFRYIKNTPIAKKIDMYIDYINKVLTNPKFSEYKNRIMVIDIDAWEKQKDPINNPIAYFALAFKRYFNMFKRLGDVNIIFYTKTAVFRLNPSLCNKDTFSLFNSHIRKLYKLADFDNDDEIEVITQKQDIKDSVSSDLKDKFNFTGDDDELDDTEDEIPEIDDIIDDIVDNEVDSNDIDIPAPHMDESDDAPEEDVLVSKQKNVPQDKTPSTKKIEDELGQKLSTDSKLLQDMAGVIRDRTVGKSTASLKRDEELRKKQRDVKFKNMTLKDFEKVRAKDIPIPTIDISDKVRTTNENVKKIAFANFGQVYNETIKDKDTMSVIMGLNNKSIPVYVTGVTIDDASDELNYKETYTISLEDENRVRHTIKVDMPKFIDDKFLYLNGNKKIINNQLFMKPIVKTGPDGAQIRSNYNRIFINRYGAKLSPKIERLKKTLASGISDVQIKIGDNSAGNNSYKTTLEYDELAKIYSYVKHGKIEILFSQEEVAKRIDTSKLKPNEFCIGFNNSQPILVDYEKETINGLDIVDYISQKFGDKFKEAYDKAPSGGKRFAYSRARIMKKDVPLILLLGYCEGLSTVLKKANVKHRFSDTKVSPSDSEGVIRFSDGYLVYDKYPFENSLLMNAMDGIPTKAYAYSDFDDKEVYIELFEIMFSARNLANAFDSFYEFMIDPITEEVLEDLDYPTDFVSVLLFANALLADNSYITENNMNLYRIRSNEVVNGILHRVIADAYAKYRVTANNRNPVKISIPRDIVIKELLQLSTVEEFSVLNPIYEVEKIRAISPKGFNGMNLDAAYTQDKRSYDKTMLGILGMSTSNDKNVGVVRQLALEPSIKNPRGYIDINDNDLKSLKDVNLFTPAELLTPLGVTHDDAIRTTMSSKQSKHIIPVAKSSPVLISNGVEQSIHYYLSKDFVIVAKDNGEVVEIDNKTGIIIVKYNDGNIQAVETAPRVVKNSSSGFYISNTLKCDLKVGDKVKKNDIIAYEGSFFSNDSLNGNRFNIGSMQKVAVMSSYATYEDSTFVTKKMSEDMASDIIMMKDVVIGKNANVGTMVKIGDSVVVGDTLIEFETSYEDDAMNKFLATVGDELKEEIQSLGRVPIKTKYSGVIEDIRIYSSVDVEELSPTLQKIVSEYYSGINRKKKLLTKYDKTEGPIKAGILFNEPTGKILPTSDGKIKGREVFEGILVEFYIKYRDPISVGDKITFFSALKSIVGEVVTEGYEPYSEFRPDEEVSTFIGPSAILQRMTPSVILTMFGNKVLVELKRKLEEIYTKQ